MTRVINPDKLFEAAFPALLSLAVAIIFDRGLDLVPAGHPQRGVGAPAVCRTGLDVLESRSS